MGLNSSRCFAEVMTYHLGGRELLMASMTERLSEKMAVFELQFEFMTYLIAERVVLL